MSQHSPQKGPVILLTSVVSLITGLVGNLFAGLIQQYTIDENAIHITLWTLAVLLILGLIAGAWLEYRPIAIPLKKRIYWILAIILTSWIVLSTGLSFIYAALRPPTTYFLVDATEKMQPIFGAIIPKIAQAPIPNSQIGLRVYGGNVNISPGCGNTRQLVKPELYRDSTGEIESNLALVEPGGQSSLVGGVIAALHDLAGHNEPIKLMIFTSGTDPQCDPPEGGVGILQEEVRSIPSNINVVITSIGNLSREEEDIFKSYAIAFHWGYANAKTPAQIPDIVETVSSYGSQDYLYPTPTP